MKIDFEHIDTHWQNCDGNDCKELPEYFWGEGYMKRDSMCVVIHIGRANFQKSFHYCLDCSEDIFEEVNLHLNPKFRAFK